MPMSDLRKSIGYTIWANTEWLHFLTDNAVHDSNLLSRMSHILLSEMVWFQRIEGVAPDKDIWQLLTLPQMEELNSRHKPLYRRLLEEDAERMISYKRLSGEEHQTAVSDILMHLMVHGAHHRGQMATLASKTGLKTINTDYITYCRKQDIKTKIL